MTDSANSNILFESLLILLLIVANGFFAASEIAIVSARKGRLEQQAERGDAGARTALALLESPSRFLSTVQVGITLLGTFAAVFGGASIVKGAGCLVAQYFWVGALRRGAGARLSWR
jgi:Hemolysins and related proteins containing CBS domains